MSVIAIIINKLMSTVAIYSEGSSDTKVLNWLILSEKVSISDCFILPPL